jgi:hypothetical protein
MRDYRRFQAPSSNGFNNKYLFLILGIFFIVAGLALKILALGLPWFALAINWIAKWTIVLGVACITPTIWRLFATTKEMKNQSSNYNLSSLYSSDFIERLYEMNLYENDTYNSNKVRFPKVKITNSGFKLSAIGKLRKQLLDDDTIGDFNSFLALKNAKCAIQSAYYKDGYVHYVVRNSISKDRLHF